MHPEVVVALPAARTVPRELKPAGQGANPAAVVVALGRVRRKTRNTLPLTGVRPTRERHRLAIEEQLQMRWSRWPAKPARLQSAKVCDAVFEQIHLQHLRAGLRRETRFDAFVLDRREAAHDPPAKDRKSTRLNSSHRCISYAVF